MSDEKKKGSCSFEDMPSIVADLVGQVRELNIKVDVLVKSGESERRRSDTRRTMSIEEVSEMLGMKRGSLYHLTSRGQIPCCRAGRRLVFFEDEIVEWLESRRRRTDIDALDSADNYLSCHF